MVGVFRPSHAVAVSAMVRRSEMFPFAERESGKSRKAGSILPQR